MSEILNLAIESVRESQVAYCKFITANDVGKTGAHQSGYHIHKSAWSLFFDTPGERGKNRDEFINIKWQNDFVKESRFIYYGVGTRDEYRLTRFGQNFPYLSDENVGDLLVLVKKEKKYYEAFVLNTDEQIEDFLAQVNLNITNVNGLIKDNRKPVKDFQSFFEEYIKGLKVDFPTAKEISKEAKRIFNEYKNISNKLICTKPDDILVGWIDTEYQLFKAIETSRYSSILNNGFKNLDSLIEFSNTILNRRKSRAGKSLENHLAEVFTVNSLRFETQVKTEGNKKPDFIFPGQEEYHNKSFLFEGLTFLGAKTTCKDRWRQIINEAKRIPQKHLFTLQQGISSNQLHEMKEENITLVVPSKYIKSFPEEHRKDIMTLHSFIEFVQRKEKLNF